MMFPQIPILAVSKTFQSITHKTLCRLGRKPQSNNIAFNFVSFNFSLRGTKRQGPAKRVLDWVEILIEFPQHCHLRVSGGANRYLKQVPLRQALNQVSTQNRSVKLLYGMLSSIAVAKLTWQSVTIWFCFSSSSACEIMANGWQLFSSGQTVVLRRPIRGQASVSRSIRIQSIRLRAIVIQTRLDPRSHSDGRYTHLSLTEYPILYPPIFFVMQNATKHQYSDKLAQVPTTRDYMVSGKRNMK